MQEIEYRIPPLVNGHARQNGGPRFLVVGPSNLVRFRCRTVLEARGYCVDDASSWQIGLLRYAQVRPQGVVLDGGGLDAPTDLAGLRALMQMDPASRVAMLLWETTSAAFEEALRLGARDFVLKPFEGERLLAAAHRLLA